MHIIFNQAHTRTSILRICTRKLEWPLLANIQRKLYMHTYIASHTHAGTKLASVWFSSKYACSVLAILFCAALVSKRGAHTDERGIMFCWLGVWNAARRTDADAQMIRTSSVVRKPRSNCVSVLLPYNQRDQRALYSVDVEIECMSFVLEIMPVTSKTLRYIECFITNILFISLAWLRTTARTIRAEGSGI